jgi:metal-sulfur cluster biosynthetic enzyme
MNDDILAALKAVIDPELGINIVDLGLVYHAVRNAAGIDIALTMTTPACPLGEMMTEEIKLVLRDRFPRCRTCVSNWSGIRRGPPS